MVTNPGAQYDATVKAVVLIRTLKPVGEGLGFNVKTANMYGENFLLSTSSISIIVIKAWIS